MREPLPLYGAGVFPGNVGNHIATPLNTGNTVVSALYVICIGTCHDVIPYILRVHMCSSQSSH